MPARPTAGCPTASRRRWAVVAVLLGVVVAQSLLAHPSIAVAASGSGARSAVTPRGEIVTTVLFGTSRRTVRPGRAGTAPRCRWSTLGDGSLEWLVAVGSAPEGRATVAGALVDLLAGAGDRALDEQVVQVLRCGGATTGRFRLVPATGAGTSRLSRSMVTRLPPPAPTISPPVAAAVPVGEPVFVSFRTEAWQPVRATLSVGAVTAEVEAAPRRFRIVTGDPGTGATTCDGPAVPYRPRLPVTPARQAALAGRCAVRFVTPTGTEGRPVRWTGTVTVLWSARWRLVGGPWQDLGLVPRTGVTTRAVREATTAVESPS